MSKKPNSLVFFPAAMGTGAVVGAVVGAIFMKDVAVGLGMGVIIGVLNGLTMFVMSQHPKQANRSI